MSFSVVPFEKVVNTVTIYGKIVKIEDEVKLRQILTKFSIATMIASRMLWRGYPEDVVMKEIQQLLSNYWYAESCLKQAKAIVESCHENGGDPYSRGIRKLFVFSRGNKSDRGGNRNITIEKQLSPTKFLVRVLVAPRKKVSLIVDFGKYTPIVNDVLLIVKHYGARIVYRDNKYLLHISVPLSIYLKHVRKYDRPIADRYAIGIDLNAGFLNWVIVDKETYLPVKYGKIEFWEVCSSGYPRARLYTELLYKIGNLFEWCRYYGVDMVVLENLFLVKQRRQKFKSKNINRKVTRFAKRKLLVHIGIKAMKYGLRVYLVDSRDSSLAGKYLGKYIFKRLGTSMFNYRHFGLEYIIALRALAQLKQGKNIQTYSSI